MSETPEPEAPVTVSPIKITLPDERGRVFLGFAIDGVAAGGEVSLVIYRTDVPPDHIRAEWTPDETTLPPELVEEGDEDLTWFALSGHEASNLGGRRTRDGRMGFPDDVFEVKVDYGHRVDRHPLTEVRHGTRFRSVFPSR